MFPAKNPKKILLVYIEPVPYIVGLINTLLPRCAEQIDIVFLAENVSQNWNMNFDPRWQVLPKNKLAKFYFLSRLLIKKNYDLIHLAGWSEPACLLLLMTAKILRIPVVIESDTPLFDHAKLWKRVIKRLIYPTLFCFVNLFMPGGIRQALYLQFYGVPAERIVPLQMTVDVDSIKRYIATLTTTDRIRLRQRYQLSENNTVFLYVGRLVAYKGLATLLTIFQQQTVSSMTLLIVGDGEMRAQVEECAKTCAHIRYAGRLSNQDLLDAYYAADVFVLPAHYEPWGLVVNEAMAVGLPVIVSDRVGCADDLVRDGETGYIVKANCRIALQQTLLRMLNVSERTLLAQQAQKIIANWTLTNEVNNLCQAWKRLLHK